MPALSLKIAGLFLRIEFSSQKWFKYCQDKYRSFLVQDGAGADLNILITLLKSKSLTDLRAGWISANRAEIWFPNSFQDFQWLNYTIKNIFAKTLLMRNGCFIHGSSAALNGDGIIFAGKSGQGKSTAAKILKLPILADDRSIVRFVKRRPLVFGSPFYERRPFAKVPGRYRLKAIFLLKKIKIDTVKIKKIPTKQSIFKLIPHIVVNEVVPGQVLKYQFLKAIDIAKLLSRTVSVYSLSFPFPCESDKLKENIYDSIN